MTLASQVGANSANAFEESDIEDDCPCWCLDHSGSNIKAMRTSTPTPVVRRCSIRYVCWIAAIQIYVTWFPLRATMTIGRISIRVFALTLASALQPNAVLILACWRLIIKCDISPLLVVCHNSCRKAWHFCKSSLTHSGRAKAICFGSVCLSSLPRRPNHGHKFLPKTLRNITK